VYQATTSIPTLNNGQNLAPQLKQDKVEPAPAPSKPFNEWVKEMTEKLERQHQDVWRELHLVWLLITLFIEGKHMLRKRHRGFGFDVIPMPESTAAAVREQNKLGFYSRTLLSKHTASRTRIDGVPGDNSEQAAGAARIAEDFLESQQTRIYDEQFRQHEGLGGQITGSCARYFCFDPKVDGGYAHDPIVETQDVKLGEDVGQCLECGYEGMAEEFGAVSMPAGGGYSADLAGGSEGFGEPVQSGNPAELALRQGSDFTGSDPQVRPTPEDYSGEVYADEASAALACPQCGSTIIQIDEMPSVPVQNVTGYNKRKLGNLRSDSVPYTRLRHEIGTTLEKSPWMRWSELRRIEEIKYEFRGVKVSPIDGQNRDSGLEVEETLQRTVGGYQNTGALGYWSKDRVSYGKATHWWLEPAMYWEYIFPADEQTVDGQTIPAGTKAIDAFPDGMHFILVSGNDQPLALENDAKNDHWITFPYHLRFLAGMGIGINDTVEMQRQWNVVLALVFTHIRTAALPGWIYDKDTISPDEVRKLGQPQTSVPASLRNKPENTRLEQLVYQMAPGQIPSHIPWYIQQLDANMQTSAGALIDEGLPGNNSTTATGVNENVSAAQQHNMPEFALKGDADVRSGYIMIELARKHMPEDRFLTVAGKWGRYDVMQFCGADLDAGVFRLEAKRDSWQPNTRMQKQQGIEKVLTLAGGVIGLLELQQSAPDLLDQIEEAYDVTIHGDTYSANVVLCRQRLDQIKQNAPMFEQMAAEAMAALVYAPPMFDPMEEPMDDGAEGAGMTPPAMVDPMTGAPIDPQMMLAEEIVNTLRPPIEPEEPGHLLSIDYLRQWFITDEGKEASDIERASVKAMIKRHIQGQITEDQITAMAQMASMPMAPPDEGQGQQGKSPKSDSDKRKQSAQSNLRPKPGNPMPQHSRPQQPVMAV